MAKVAQAKLAAGGGEADGDFYRAKLATGRFYMARVLPQTGGLFSALMAGAKPVMELEAELF
jgi:hypothetical protein